MSSRFPATHGRAKRQHDQLTAVDLRWRGVGRIASITSGAAARESGCGRPLSGRFRPFILAAIQPNRAEWRPASVHCPGLAWLESFRLAGGASCCRNGTDTVPVASVTVPIPQELGLCESISLHQRVCSARASASQPGRVAVRSRGLRAPPRRCHLEKAQACRGQGRVASGRAVTRASASLSPTWCGRPSGSSPSTTSGHGGTVDQGGQERDQMDAAVLLHVWRQRRAPSAPCASLRSGQLHADASDAHGGKIASRNWLCNSVTATGAQRWRMCYPSQRDIVIEPRGENYYEVKLGHDKNVLRSVVVP